MAPPFVEILGSIRQSYMKLGWKPTILKPRSSQSSRTDTSAAQEPIANAIPSVSQRSKRLDAPKRTPAWTKGKYRSAKSPVQNWDFNRRSKQIRTEQKRSEPSSETRPSRAHKFEDRITLFREIAIGVSDFTVPILSPGRPSKRADCPLGHDHSGDGYRSGSTRNGTTDCKTETR